MVAVVLMGAGASYGSEKSTHRPPLGADLFGALEQAGRIAKDLPEAIKKAFKLDFERGMLDYYEYSNGNTMRFQREMARFLAAFSPSAESVYLSLIRSLGPKRVIYSSLNYDLLFEKSASILGFLLNYTSHRLTGQINILKLHGSSNFWPIISGEFKNVTIEGCRVDLDAPISILNPAQTLRRCELEDSLAPAMAIYAPGKAVKVCPDFVKGQQDQWLNVLQKATKIFIVGTRVHPSDHHIWQPLGRCSAWIGYFGLADDKASFDKWRQTYLKQRAYFFEANFSSSVSLIQQKLLNG